MIAYSQPWATAQYVHGGNLYITTPDYNAQFHELLVSSLPPEACSVDLSFTRYWVAWTHAPIALAFARRYYRVDVAGAACPPSEEAAFAFVPTRRQAVRRG